MSRLNFALSIGLLAVVLAPYWWEDFPAMAALADGCVDTLDQMRAYHDFVE